MLINASPSAFPYMVFQFKKRHSSAKKKHGTGTL